MTKETKQQDNTDETTIELAIAGMESGIDPDTGETKYKVHFHPTTMNKKEYEQLMTQQLASEEDSITVRL